MVQLQIKISGLPQLSRNLKATSNNVKNLQPWYEDSVNILSDRSDDIFKREGKNVEKGPKWKSLSALTKQARKKRTGYYKKSPIQQDKTLVWTGNLRDNRTKRVNKFGGQLKFNAPYAGIHQEGKGKVPPRPIIDISNSVGESMIKALQAHIFKGTNFRRT